MLLYAQFFFVYLPAQIVLYHTSNPTLTKTQVESLSLTLFIALAVLLLPYRLPLRSIGRATMSPTVASLILVTIVTALMAYLWVELGSNFRIADFVDIYDVRASAVQDAHRLARYSEMWLAGFGLPVLIAVAAARRRLLIGFPIAALAYIMLFGLAGAKASVLAPVFVLLIYLALFQSRVPAPTIFAWLAPLALYVPVIIGGAIPGIAYWYTAIVHMRIFSSPSLNLAKYADFFSTHPVTHFSHVSGVSWLVDYPYGMSISHTIQGAYGGGVANANFWASDGLASMGLLGVIITSMLCAAVFWTLDCIAQRHDQRLVALTLSFVALTFSNVSLFTTIVSGGLGLIAISLLIGPNLGFQARLEMSVARAGVHLR